MTQDPTVPSPTVPPLSPSLHRPLSGSRTWAGRLLDAPSRLPSPQQTAHKGFSLSPELVAIICLLCFSQQTPVTLPAAWGLWAPRSQAPAQPWAPVEARPPPLSLCPLPLAQTARAEGCGLDGDLGSTAGAGTLSHRTLTDDRVADSTQEQLHLQKKNHFFFLVWKEKFVSHGGSPCTPEFCRTKEQVLFLQGNISSM